MAAAAPRSRSGRWLLCAVASFRSSGVQGAQLNAARCPGDAGPAGGLHLPPNGPHETCQLAGHGHHRLGLHHPARGQALVLGRQAQLRLPRDVRDRLGQLVVSPGDDRAHPSVMPVVPGHLHQHAPRSAVAGLGDGALPALAARAVFAGHQAEVGHQLARVLETHEVLQLRDDGDGRDQLHTAHGLQRLHDGREGPGGQLVAQGLLEPGDASGRLVDAVQILLEADLLGRLRQPPWLSSPQPTASAERLLPTPAGPD